MSNNQNQLRSYMHHIDIIQSKMQRFGCIITSSSIVAQQGYRAFTIDTINLVHIPNTVICNTIQMNKMRALIERHLDLCQAFRIRAAHYNETNGRSRAVFDV